MWESIPFPGTLNDYRFGDSLQSAGVLGVELTATIGKSIASS